jgi:hypothetical protein
MSSSNSIGAAPAQIIFEQDEPKQIVLSLANTTIVSDGTGGTGPAFTMPTGFSVSGSGTSVIAVSYAVGYSLPTTAKQSEWDSAAADTASILARLAKLRYANCIYVAENGNDLDNTGTIDSPLRTVRAAALIAQPGDVVFIAPGTYTEPTLPIRWKHDVTVFGSGLRSTVIQPAAGQEFNDIFKVDSGFWCWGISFAGHQVGSWAIDFNELADNTARGAVGLGAFVLKSPYIQNCTSITASCDDGTAGSQCPPPTGGGIRVDGDKCAKNSPIRSMVVDSYTQVNLGGPGCLVLNDGYAQLVSFFGTFCTYHVRTETGGQVNLSGGGTTDFGIYGLMADGYSKKPLYVGDARVAAYGALRAEKTVTIDVDTDVFSSTAHTLVAGDQVVFTATQGALPTGLAGNTIYYVIASGLTADVFKVSDTQGGSSIDMSGSATGTYQFLRQGVTELDVVGFTANRLGRQIKYPTAGSLGSPGNPVTVSAVDGSEFTVTLATSTINHEYVGGGTVTVSGTSYPVVSAVYTKSTGATVLIATGYTPTIGDSLVLSGLSFICDSASRPNVGQLMFPQLVFPRNAATEAPEAKTFAYTRTGDFTLTYTETAAPSGPEHEYVSGGTATIGGLDYGVANAVYNKDTGVVTLTTKTQLPAGNGDVTVDGLQFICPTSAYIVTSSIPIDSSGTPVANDSPSRAGYRVVFFSGLNDGLRDPITAGQKLDFRNRSQVSAPSHTFEFVGSGTNYDALPWNGGVSVPANAIIETNNGRVYSSNTNEKGDFAVGSRFSVDGTTGSVTIDTDDFNLSGLNFIGPFSRNGGISTVGEQLREVSNNTSLIASTGGADGNTVPSQFAVKTYADDRFLQNVTVAAGLPLTITDTSVQDGQGFWMRSRNVALSLNEANGLAQLDSSGLIPVSILSEATTSTAGSMSSADKIKLDGIDAGAEVNVNADWNASSGDAQILNKPSIPAPADAAPLAPGTAAVGSSTDYAREDHVHPLPGLVTSTTAGLMRPVDLGDVIVLACSDETTDLATGTAKVTFRMPWAATLTDVRLSVNTAPTGSALIVDVNEGGVSVFGTLPQIDDGDTTSVGSVVAPVISDSALAADAEITVDIDQVGSSAAGKGLKVALYVTRV